MLRLPFLIEGDGWTLYRSLTEMASHKCRASGYTQGLERTQSTRKKSHAVHGSLPSQLLSWLCNLLCGLRVSSLSQVVICHAKCVKQKASANPKVNAGAQRDCVDGDISGLCNYTSKPPSDWCIWFVISALLCVWMWDVMYSGKHTQNIFGFFDTLLHFSHTPGVWSGERTEIRLASKGCWFKAMFH